YSAEQMAATAQAAEELGHLLPASSADLKIELDNIRTAFSNRSGLVNLPPAQRLEGRKWILHVNNQLTLRQQEGTLPLLPEVLPRVGQLSSQLRSATDYAPTWVLVAVACALGVGTTVGWKRIVVTVGEKIGKTHMTYAQGAAAELVAMGAIGFADGFGWPVSTTHVLASGIAGTMAANRSGLQMATIRSIALAWVLTLPAAMLLAGGLFLAFRLFVV